MEEVEVNGSKRFLMMNYTKFCEKLHDGMGTNGDETDFGFDTAAATTTKEVRWQTWFEKLRRDIRACAEDPTEASVRYRLMFIEEQVSKIEEVMDPGK